MGSGHWISMFIFNTLRPRQNGRHFADDTFKCIFVNENVRILIEISLKFVPKGPINNIPSLVQIMAWRRPGDKPLSEPMMISLLAHICVTRPQWVNTSLTTLRFCAVNDLDSVDCFAEHTNIYICFLWYFLSLRWCTVDSWNDVPWRGKFVESKGSI